MADVCVIFNPAAGKHRARQRLERLQATWGARLDMMPTNAPGHARGLARQAALDGYRIVVAAGGDGTVHEVANGLLEANRPDVCFAVVPIGSANDYAHSLGFDDDSSGRSRSRLAEPRSVDVGIIRASSGKEEYFVCCLGLGFNGAVTLESRRIRRLQGAALYGLATLRALWHHYRCPTMEIAIDDEPARSAPTLMFSVLLGRREGGFVLAPNARLDDGLFDYVHTGNLSRWQVMRLLPQLALFGPPQDHPQLRQGQCRRVRLTSPEPLIIHVDGEFFASPQDDIRSVDIQILPLALKVAPLELGERGASAP